MDQQALIAKLHKAGSYAKASRFFRLATDPFRYLKGTLHHNLLYRFTKKGLVVKDAPLFWGDSIQLILPSSLDIYLAGAKTDDSEIRLAKFLVNTITDGDDVLDVGAHIGYFTLLASFLSKKGTVYAVEAARGTYAMLQTNAVKKNNVKTFNLALSDTNGETEFLEFPVLYSEYNTLEPQHYEKENWFQKIKPVVNRVQTQTGDIFLKQHNITPSFIKIDVEGAEEKVISGLQEYLSASNPFVIMEFANNIRGNKPHISAENILQQLGYHAHCITNDGEMIKIKGGTSAYVEELRLVSDNIVYKKST